MKIEKLDLGKFGINKAVESALPHAPKNFSFFGKSEDQQIEFTRAELTAKTNESQKKGFDDGYLKGKDEVMQGALAVEQSTKAAIDGLAANMAKFLASYEEEKKNFMRNMTKVTISAIQKIAHKAIKENAEEVIFQALEKSSAIFTKQPEVVLKAKKDVIEKIRARLDESLKTHDFKGKISYHPDESCADGNCIIEWGESGVNINADEMVKQIEETLSEYLKSI